MTKIYNLTPEVQKMIDVLKWKYTDVNITLTDNYKWLQRDDLRGTYTLSSSISEDGFDNTQLSRDITDIQNISK